jgi:hypothetical protein
LKEFGQVFISWYSWKLGIGRKLADLEREMEETELLIGSEDTLKSNNILKKKARRLVFGFIPLLVRASRKFFLLYPSSCLSADQWNTVCV